MGPIFLLVLLLGILMPEINCTNEMTKLSRRKRYVAFPEGATLSIAICMTAQTIMRPAEIWTEGLNWGISYDLPNNTALLQGYVRPPRAVAQRRHRRDLYQKMELIMDSMGYNGRHCIYRALCEAGGFFKGKGATVIEEILRIVFGFPHQRPLDSEPEEHKEYHRAHGIGRERGDLECSATFPGCTFSLLDLALGHYTDQSTPLFNM